MPKILTGEALQERCKKLGIDTQGEYVTFEELKGKNYRREVSEAVLQLRLIEVERAIRESRAWMLTILSAIASVCSAIVAILAVANKVI